MRLIKKYKKYLPELGADLTRHKTKEEHIHQVEYYFMIIYKSLRAYERIFRHLWEKERMEMRKLKKDAEKGKWS